MKKAQGKQFTGQNQLQTLQNLINTPGYLPELFFFFSTSCFSCCTETETRRVKGATRVKRDSIFIDNDPLFLQKAARFAAGNAFSSFPHIDKYYMRIGSS